MKSLPAMYCLALLMPVLATAGPAKLEDTLRLPDAAPGPGKQFAIVLSGDGGWAELVREVAAGLSRADIPCVGWNSRSYYWTRRNPTAAAQDLSQLVARFRREWSRSRMVLVGYSRGADVLPFLITRLPKADLECVDLVVLLAPGRTIDFELHLSDFLRESKSADGLAVSPEIARLRGTPLLVLYGDHDAESCGSVLPRDLGRIQSLPGDHHLGRDYSRIVREILDALGRKAAPPDPAQPLPPRRAAAP